ncbi:hypothetical protein [Streptomyces sp. NPDC058157]|uniref:hypothetical protein n=1 Tax=Streptomyces sp. NPDC058157 TaxID=3346360 RepID=UPI0036E6495A
MDASVAGDALYNGAHMYIGESDGGGPDAWRGAIDTVEALAPGRIVAGRKNRDLDDDATRVIAATRRYLDDAEAAQEECSSPTGFFHRMRERHPDLPYGKTVLRVGAKVLYALREPGADPGAAAVGTWFYERSPVVVTARPPMPSGCARSSSWSGPCVDVPCPGGSVNLDGDQGGRCAAC